MIVSKGKRSISKLLKRKKTRKTLSAVQDQVTSCSASDRSDFVCSTVEPERRWEIISAFGRVLERCSSPIEQESSLPYPKDLIRRAIYEELSENPINELRSHLEIAYVQLEAFLPPEEFKVIEEFKTATSLAQELASSGDPNAIIASARILKEAKGDRAVEIEEDVSEKMKKRLNQVRSIQGPIFRLGTYDASARL